MYTGESFWPIHLIPSKFRKYWNCYLIGIHSYIDRVTDYVLGESVKAYKNITINEPCFMGHFPEQPIFPGVLILEAMAQAAGVLGFKTMGNNDKLYLYAGLITHALSVLLFKVTGLSLMLL